MANISMGYFSSQHFIFSDYKISPDVVKMVAKKKKKKSNLLTMNFSIRVRGQRIEYKKSSWLRGSKSGFHA